jgi:hypothetical protein
LKPSLTRIDLDPEAVSDAAIMSALGGDSAGISTEMPIDAQADATGGPEPDGMSAWESAVRAVAKEDQPEPVAVALKRGVIFLPDGTVNWEAFREVD